MPWLYLGALFSYLDRGNLSYAALQLNADLGAKWLKHAPAVPETATAPVPEAALSDSCPLHDPRRLHAVGLRDGVGHFFPSLCVDCPFLSLLSMLPHTSASPALPASSDPAASRQLRPTQIHFLRFLLILCSPASEGQAG